MSRNVSIYYDPMLEADRAAEADLPAPLNLPAIEQAQAAQVGAPPAPISGYQSLVRPTAEVQQSLANIDSAHGPYTAEQDQKLWDRAYEDATGERAPGSDGSSKGLVSTKPAWYEGGKPSHPDTGWGAAAAGLKSLAGAAGQAAAARGSNPMRPGYLVNRDYGQAALLGLGGTLIDYFNNKKSKDEQTDLDTASKQAQMYRNLAGSNGHGGTTSAADVIRLRNQDTGLDLSRERTKSTITNQAVTQQKKADEDDPNSPLSRAYVQSAVDMKKVTPDQVGKLSLRQLKDGSPWLQQANSQDFRDWEMRAQHTLNSQEKANESTNSQNVKNVQAENEETQALNNMQIPGGQWQQGKIPSQKDYTAVQELVRSRDTVMSSARRLQAISQYFDTKYGSDILTRGLQYVKERGLNFDRQDQEFLTEAANIKNNITTAVRLSSQMGAPQEFEQRLVSQLTNNTSNVGGVLFPKEFYDGVINSINQSSAVGMQSHGFTVDGVKPLAPVVKPERKVYQAQPMDYTGGQAAPIPRPFNVPAPRQASPQRLPDVPVVNEKLSTTDGVPPIPGSAKKAAAPQKVGYVVDYGDGEPPAHMELSDDEVKEYQAAGAKLQRVK